ncbi:MAG TPA: hypothetical protein VFM68_00020 [Candidatus Saccharimonadales bacterium]|nr:hypothetical protein [Candidatus Saccharimonadales bacterium]
MSIIDRVRQLNLPLDEVVVIGSGVLDALKLRPAGDVDLVVTANLFADLASGNDWQITAKGHEVMLQQDDVEAFLSWGSEAKPNFRALYDEGTTIDGVRFASPQFVVDWKKQRMSEKDKADITLLEEYLNR